MSYKIKAPIGNTIVPKEVMTEKEVRQFALDLLQESEDQDTWREKIQKDSIAEVIDWLKNLSYEVKEV